MRRYRTLVRPRPRWPRRSVPAEPSRQLDVEGVEVDVADLLKQLGGAGSRPGSRADDHATPGTRPPERGAPRGHLPIGPAWSSAAAGAVGVPTAAATVQATHLGNGRRLNGPAGGAYGGGFLGSMGVGGDLLGSSEFELNRESLRGMLSLWSRS